MSRTLIEQLLKSEQIIIPYEESHGTKQVSSLVCRVGNRYSSLSFVDDDRNYGPTGLIDSGLSSDEVERWIKSPDARIETIDAEDIRVTTRYFLSEGECAEAVTDIILIASGGRIVRLSTEGASYSYGFVMLPAPSSMIP